VSIVILVEFHAGVLLLFSRFAGTEQSIMPN